MHPVEVGDIGGEMTTTEEVISAPLCCMTLFKTAKALLIEFWPRNSLSGWPLWSPRKVKISQRPGWSESVLPLSIYAQPPREVQMIGLADKLSNMRDIDRD